MAGLHPSESNDAGHGHPTCNGKFASTPISPLSSQPERHVEVVYGCVIWYQIITNHEVARQSQHWN
jgi:hypothetical protein